MGTLIVKHYPTILALKAADHTYIECGTGAKGWGCWGGKAGGATLRQGTGSTERADAIAEPNEKAGVSCYLFNGVCHQASNRILQAAGLSVDGVRGYTFSVAAFGHYGRQKTMLSCCQSALLGHEHVRGDLLACSGTELHDSRIDSKRRERVLYDYLDTTYMSAVNSIYRRDSANEDSSRQVLFHLQIELFMALLQHRARRTRVVLDRLKEQRVIRARAKFENERLSAELEISGFDQRLEFASMFNSLTNQLQEDLAEVLDNREYAALLGLSRDERIVLADPDILDDRYEPSSGPRRPTP